MKHIITNNIKSYAKLIKKYKHDMNIYIYLSLPVHVEINGCEYRTYPSIYFFTLETNIKNIGIIRELFFARLPISDIENTILKLDYENNNKK